MQPLTARDSFIVPHSRDSNENVCVRPLPVFFGSSFTREKNRKLSQAMTMFTLRQITVYLCFIFLVPGSGGSQLQAKLNKPKVLHWYCDKTTSDYFTLWLKKSSLLPYAIDCWADNMRSRNLFVTVVITFKIVIDGVGFSHKTSLIAEF